MGPTAIKKSFTYGSHQVTLETGEISRQAHGAVIVSMEDTVVLCTVVGAKQAKPGQDFFPLTVNYQEKAFAAGKIPGGFFKRETRPRDYETLVARITDRSIRPLFPKGYRNEVQVIATVLSFDGIASIPPGGHATFEASYRVPAGAAGARAVATASLSGDQLDGRMETDCSTTFLAP